MKKTIEVTFSTDGTFSVHAHGFRGSACQSATKALEEALGDVQSRRHTEEFFRSETTKNQQQIGK